jgi:hypothetical protein
MNKKMEYMKPKVKKLETNKKSLISGTFIGASTTLRRVTSLELIYRSK